ncbi:MAG: Rrf2 family transcriptional regulator [Johnsonella sp.]|nr:Rrf2 family transcriptional regulator [Johnsonella sp.]
MKISTKGRYALRVMIDLAEHRDEEYIPLKDIAGRQKISEKYLESIIKLLVKEKMLVGLRGKGGGYKLTKSPQNYTVGDILRVSEESLAPVACLENMPIGCPKAGECKTLPIWIKLDKLINDYFDSISIEDLIGTSPEHPPND